MGGFLGIGGTAAKTDRSNELGGFKDMGTLFNYALPTGTDATSKASGYYGSLLSGSRPAIEAAVQPETNAIRSGADAQKRQLASFGTARGGGTGSSTQQIDTGTRASVGNLIAGVRPTAAAGEAKIGAEEQETAGRMASETTQLASTSRELSNKLTNQVVGDFGTLIDTALNYV